MLTEAEQATWATKVPDEYSFMTNSNSNILNWVYTGHKVLKNLGAPVEIVFITSTCSCGTHAIAFQTVLGTNT